MKIGIIVGSIRKDRRTISLAKYLKDILIGTYGIDTKLIDLQQMPLPLFGLNAEGEDNIEAIRTVINESDGLIFVTPEYHGTYSAVLKNCLEYYWDEFFHKPIGVATASISQFAGINASIQLQHLILSLRAFPVPLKLLVSEIQNVFDAKNKPLNDMVVEHTEKFIEEFLWFTNAIVSAKQDV